MNEQSLDETFILLDGQIETIVDGETPTIGNDKIVIIPVNSWREFKNCSDKLVQMINIHPVPKMVTE